MLQEAGLSIGSFVAEVVREDRELLAILRSGERSLLDQAIWRRNAQHQDWGFKIPDLHAYLRHTDLARFRNPHLVVTFRDAVAVGVRNTISEKFEAFTTLAETAAAQLAVVEFVRGASCPCLLLSYEKALVFPAEFVDALTGFSGLRPSPALRERLIRLVRPNAEDYLQRARRRFHGSIDTLDEGRLQGWCCEMTELAPVHVDLFLDDVKVASVRADLFRSDLRDAGFGNGNHGFSIDMTALAIEGDPEVRMTISGRTFVLPRSGKRLSAYAPEVPQAPRRTRRRPQSSASP